MEYFKFIKSGDEITIKVNAGVNFYTFLSNLDMAKMDKIEILKLHTALELLLKSNKLLDLQKLKKTYKPKS